MASIRKRVTKDGKRHYQLRVVTGYDDNGKRQVYVETYSTLDAAKKALIDIEGKIERGQPPTTERKVTVDAFIDRYLATRKPELARITWEDTAYLMNRFVRPHLGAMRVDRLTPFVLQDFVAKVQGSLQTKRSTGGTPMVRNIIQKLRAALEYAVHWQIRTDNPARYISQPRRPHVEREAVTAEMARALIAAARELPLRSYYITAISTGFRPQELRGLQWQDLDTRRATLTSARVVNHYSDGWVIKEHKTTRSARTVSIPPGLVAELQQHRVAQVKARVAAGPYWEENAFIFTDEIGRPLKTRLKNLQIFPKLIATANAATRKALDEELEAALKEARTAAARQEVRLRFEEEAKRRLIFERIRPYDLRHACAQLLLAEGVDLKTISDQLGHSSIAITANVYLKRDGKLLRGAAAALEGSLFSDSSSGGHEVDMKPSARRSVDKRTSR